ncbi:MAG TPA: FtsX-like permease family protein, partial [Bryobacteraceae bacterium]|nr:FtsX-like permease family protein [Bryobacteraceae bacterium]
GMLQRAVPEMYAPYTVKGFWPDMRWNMRILVRSTLDTNSIAGAVRREVQAVDPAQPIYAVQGMNLVIENTVKDKSLNTTLLSVFAGVSLLLALIGVYGVMSYTVAQHTREIGIRMALGAEAGHVRGLVGREVALMLGIGTVVGLGAAAGACRVLEQQKMLFGLKAWDPPIYAGAAFLLWVIAMVAAYVPSRRATKVDPMVALRYE